LSKQRARNVFFKSTNVGRGVGVGDHGHQRKAVVVDTMFDGVVVLGIGDIVSINSSSDDS
jgi:hypothetical protein